MKKSYTRKITILFNDRGAELIADGCSLGDMEMARELLLEANVKTTIKMLDEVLSAKITSK